VLLFVHMLPLAMGVFTVGVSLFASYIKDRKYRLQVPEKDKVVILDIK